MLTHVDLFAALMKLFSSCKLRPVQGRGWWSKAAHRLPPSRGPKVLAKSLAAVSTWSRALCIFI